MRNSIPALIDTHLAAYCEPDRARRRALVQKIWAKGAHLIDPPLTARGHAEIVDQADAVLERFPLHRFRRSSGIDVHNGYALYSWQLVDPHGQVGLEGVDVARVDESGRLAQVIGFFGPRPSHESGQL